MKATMEMCQTLRLVADDDLLSDLEHLIESKMPTRQGAKQMKVIVFQEFDIKVVTREGEELLVVEDQYGLGQMHAHNLTEIVTGMREMFNEDDEGFEVELRGAIDSNPELRKFIDGKVGDSS